MAFQHLAISICHPNSTLLDTTNDIVLKDYYPNNYPRILGHLSDTDICPTTEISFSDKNPKTDICPKVGLNYIQIMLETMVYNVWVTGCSSVRCINVCLLVYHVIRRNTRQDGSPGFVPVKEVWRECGEP